VELIPPNTNIDFMGNRRYAYAFTTIMILLSLLSYPIKGWINLGIDFTGGVSVQVQFKNKVDTEHIRKALEPMSANATVQSFSMGSKAEDYLIRMEAPEEGSEKFSMQLQELLDKSFGKGSAEIRGLEVVGPKVGHDLRQAAIWATIVALAMLLIYMAFRFTLSMGLGAIFCLVHDLIIIYGFFVWTGKEFNLTILAAMLTCIGYDINDTIVVCDRIRENLRTMRKQPLAEVLNASINQTLSRTVLTSGFTLLVVVALLIFGTPQLKDFAWALFVGIVFGTYSSIFVAAPLILGINKYIPVKRG
jgi:preprotein translocase subunit SecF